MMKNALYFTLKALSFLKIYDVTTWLKIAMHMLTSISRSKGYQAMKFGQLIEYKMRNIVLKKSHRKGGEETIPRYFLKKPKLSISLN